MHPDISKEGGIRLVLSDINERKKIEQTLEQQEKRQELAVDIASSFLNKSFKSMEATVDEVLAKIAQNLNADRSYIFSFSKEKEIMTCLYSWKGGNTEKKIIKANKTYPLTNWLSRKITGQKPVLIHSLENLPVEASASRKKFSEMSIKSMLWQPMVADGEILAVIGIDTIYKEKNWEDNDILTMKLISNITTSALKRDRAEQDLIFQTFHDQLTGLYNRRFFEEEIERLDTKRQLPLSIIMADINGLKIINDTYGHQQGDKTLIKTADILKEVFREEDIVARQGGDEFAVLLPKTNEEELKIIINRMKEKIVEVNKKENIPISIALGSAIKKNTEQNIKAIFKKADNNMYQNKLSESRNNKSNIFQGLLNTLAAKSYETKEHALRMTKLAFDFGEKLGLSNSELNRLSLLATLHDIGKTNISEEILNKPDKLNKKEWEIMKNHSEQGYKIASASEEFALVVDEILSHHEHWDGSGYPEGLKGEEIPYLARIISIIDAYEVDD
ncbi:MAG: diguanylate cyclase [Halanaerobiales bacterium]|nr:diguanylate cyclase [Halanaerobiales bacterium]